MTQTTNNSSLSKGKKSKQNYASVTKPDKPTKGFSLQKLKFVVRYQEVKKELQRITWASRRETLIATGMVFVMVAFMALFFLIVDELVSWLIQFILN